MTKHAFELHIVTSNLRRELGRDFNASGTNGAAARVAFVKESAVLTKRTVLIKK